MKDRKIFERFFYEHLKSSIGESDSIKKNEKKKLLLKQNRELRKLRRRQQFQLSSMRGKHTQQLVDFERDN